MACHDRENQNFWNAQPQNGSYHFTEYSIATTRDLLQKIKPKDVAKLGESLAASRANAAGWTTLYRGLRHIGFELDLVLQKDTALRIIEVKTLRHHLFEPHLEVICGFMNHRKTEALRRGAGFLLSRLADQKSLVHEITCELVVVHLRPHGAVKLYRWPDACKLN